MPITIWPVARVTIRAFSLSPPIRIPFTNPMRAATPTAVAIAIQMRSSDWSPTPAMIIADNVKVPGVLRSIPPVMITSIWPSAVIARSAANGAIADSATLLSVSGTQIDATTTSTTRAMYTGMKREATTNLVRKAGDEVFGVTTARSGAGEQAGCCQDASLGRRRQGPCPLHIGGDLPVLDQRGAVDEHACRRSMCPFPTRRHRSDR